MKNYEQIGKNNEAWWKIEKTLKNDETDRKKTRTNDEKERSNNEKNEK